MNLFENKPKEKQNTNIITIHTLIIVFIRMIVAVAEADRVTEPKRSSCCIIQLLTKQPIPRSFPCSSQALLVSSSGLFAEHDILWY